MPMSIKLFDDSDKALHLDRSPWPIKSSSKHAFGINYEKYRDFVIGILQNLRENKELKNEDFTDEELALLNILKDLGRIRI